MFNLCKYDYYLSPYIYDNALAQTSCVISPNLTTLTIWDQLARDVELHCQCRDHNGMMITGSRWFFGNTLVSQSNTNSPYSTNTIPNRLIIASPFTSSYAGTYTCSPNSTFPPGPPGDAIALSVESEYVAIAICI